jgi:hypothetical protein
VGEGDLNDTVNNLTDQFQGCRLNSATELAQIKAEISILKEVQVKHDIALFGAAGQPGLVTNMSSMLTTMDRLSSSLTRALDILIPPDGSAGLLVRLKSIEEIVSEAKDFKKWFYRALGASLITAVIGLVIAFLK